MPRLRLPPFDQLLRSFRFRLLTGAAAACGVVLTVLMSLTGSAQVEAVRPLSADEAAKLQPEICQAGSSLYRIATAALPFLAGSATRSTSLEQVALVDRYVPSGRHKVWALQLPAAFITVRTCDFGRENYLPGQPDGPVTQIYHLWLLMKGDQIVPLASASSGEIEKGIRVHITLNNRVTQPSSLHRAYKRHLFTARQIVDKSPPHCRDEPSDIADLVRFKRVDPNVAMSGDCEDGSHWPPEHRKNANKVYAKKLAELTYEFVALCTHTCVVSDDFNGWPLEYSYDFAHLKDWQRMRGAIVQFLSDHTAYQDREDENR